MKKLNKVFLTISFYFLLVAPTHAQTGVRFSDVDRPFSMQLFEFIGKLNNQIDSFFVKETAEAIERKLIYFKTDLQRYLILRKELMEYFESYNYILPKNNQAQKKVEVLKKQIDKLGNRMVEIEPFLSKNLSKDASSIIETLQLGIRSNKSVYLNRLDSLVNGFKVNRKKVSIDGKIIYHQLVVSLDLLQVVILKLQSKFNIG